MTETIVKIPNLAAATDIVLESPYRIGDAIAVLLMTSLIERQCGPKRWWLVQPNPLFGIFTAYAAIPQIAPLESFEGDPASLILLPDDGCLWIWNDVCHTIGHRLNFVAPENDERHSVVLMPLFEADYAAERCWHPYFVRDLAWHLSRIPGAAMVLDRTNIHDRALIEDIPIEKIERPLSEVIGIIGNCEIFIGGDTGLSHIAGMFPDVKQIGLNDRANLERHTEREPGWDHMKEHREFVLAICSDIGIDVADAEYRSFPNKRGAECILFDHGGRDDRTFEAVRDAVSRMRIVEMENAINAAWMHGMALRMDREIMGESE